MSAGWLIQAVLWNIVYRCIILLKRFFELPTTAAVQVGIYFISRVRPLIRLKNFTVFVRFISRWSKTDSSRSSSGISYLRGPFPEEVRRCIENIIAIRIISDRVRNNNSRRVSRLVSLRATIARAGDVDFTPRFHRTTQDISYLAAERGRKTLERIWLRNPFRLVAKLNFVREERGAPRG